MAPRAPPLEFLSVVSTAIMTNLENRTFSEGIARVQ